jgi:UDP-N-acetylmuramyl pentapeptide phosphotransferase/UDP-N-acetylglucosamine-1-phosphate transferase
MYGIFGFYWIPEWLAVSLSIFTLLVIVNSFNLIDGINGLSAGLGILICMTFGLWFYITDQIILCMLSFSLIGSLTAFLKYNVTPAKIFMGDTGSLLVGLICGILAIRFIELHKDIPSVEYKFISAPAVAIGILFIPLYDMLRVFIVRIISGKSPFHPDRLHVHHMMLDAGCSHMQASLILVSINALSIFLVLQFRDLGNMKLLIILFSLGLTMTFVLRTIIRKRTSLQQINH